MKSWLDEGSWDRRVTHLPTYMEYDRPGEYNAK